MSDKKIFNIPINDFKDILYVCLNYDPKCYGLEKEK